tara:strand:+ start:65 stop:994 length:930 start_codon:yes stop_codon:yes gene_type:complete
MSEPTNLQEMLREATKDILSEESLAQIEEAFEGAVNDRVEIHVEKALIEQDGSYAGKLETLLEAIDTDHTKKLQQVVEAIDVNHAQKLKVIVNRYKTALNEEAAELKEDLVDNISRYLELYVEELIPAEQLHEAVTNKRATDILQELRSLLAVDQALSKDSIRDAVMDGKQQIQEASTQLESVSEENQKLRGKLYSTEAQLLLEQRLQGYPDSKKQYVKKILGSKSPKFITENFDYTMQLFEKAEEDRLDDIKAQAKRSRARAKKNVDIVTEVQAHGERQVIKETASNLDDVQGSDPAFDTYLGELSKY